MKSPQGESVKTEHRWLWGETYDCWEITISADDTNPAAKLLKTAAKLVKDVQPTAVHVSGILWRRDPDEFVLHVFMSDS